MYEIRVLTGVSQMHDGASLMIDRIFDCTYSILCILGLGGNGLKEQTLLDLRFHLSSLGDDILGKSLLPSTLLFVSYFLTLSYFLRPPRLLLPMGMETFPLLFPTTSTSSVEGTIYGCTLLRVCVLCSYAYAYPIRLASLQAGPMKLRPNLVSLLSITETPLMRELFLNGREYSRDIGPRFHQRPSHVLHHRFSGGIESQRDRHDRRADHGR